MTNPQISSEPTALPKNENELLKTYSSLAYSIANSYRKGALPIEDLNQEALLGLLDAYKRFDPSRGVKFSTYAVHWIKKRVLSALSKEKKHSMDAIELDEAGLADQEEPSSRPDPGQILADMQNPPPLMPRSKSETLFLPDTMPLLEKHILILSYQEKHTIKEIATELGLSNEKVKQLRLKALRRLKSLL